jgi:hypothetical protein
MSSCSALILSCDKYRDIWDLCLTFHERYWPDCPYPMYLCSDSIAGGNARIRPLLAGAGLSWSDGLRALLQQVDSEYVLLMLDDFFFRSRVRTEKVEGALAALDQLGGGYMRLIPRPPPGPAVDGHPGIGEHERGAPYRTSLQAAFWRKATLEELLVPNESPWQFEGVGSRRSEAHPAKFYSVTEARLDYVDVLERGKWLPRGTRLCQREGLTIDREARGEINLRDHVRRAGMDVLAFGFGLFPWRFRRKVRDRLSMVWS